MTPKPVARGLFLCDYVIVEESTRKISLIGEMNRIRCPFFPIRPSPFYAFSLLSGAAGEGRMDLWVTELRTDRVVYTRTEPARFPDRFAEHRCVLRIDDWLIHLPGMYEFTLLVDAEWVAQRRLEVIGMEVGP